MLALSVHAQVTFVPVGTINSGGVIRGVSTLSGGIEITGDNLTDLCEASGSSFLVRANGTVDGIEGINGAYGTIITADGKYYYGPGGVYLNDDLIIETDGTVAIAYICNNGKIAFGTWYGTQIAEIPGNLVLYDPANGSIQVINFGGNIMGVVKSHDTNVIYIGTDNPGDINIHKIDINNNQLIPLTELENEIHPDFFSISGMVSYKGNPVFYGWNLYYGSTIATFIPESGWDVDVMSAASMNVDPAGEYLYFIGEDEQNKDYIYKTDLDVFEKIGPEILINAGAFIFWSGDEQYILGITPGGPIFEGIPAATFYRVDNGTKILNVAETLLNMYPNPTTGTLIIETSDLSSDVTMYNSTGQLVRTFDIISFKTEIDISNLPSGLYWVNGEAVMLQK